MTLILTLTNGYPYPAPIGQDFSGPALSAVLPLSGVKSVEFQATNKLTIITFENSASFRAAKALTGWPEWDGEGLMLEARLGPSGYIARWLHPGCPDWPTLETEFRAIHISAR
jgi:hypothetical protein